MYNNVYYFFFFFQVSVSNSRDSKAVSFIVAHMTLKKKSKHV